MHPQPFDFTAIMGAVKKVLRRAMDVVEPLVRGITDVVARKIGLRRAPDDQAPLRTLALWVALVTGTFGALLWCLPLLLLFMNVFIAMGGHVGTAVVILRLLAGFAGAATFAVGGAAGLTGDRRGASTVWAAGWFLLASNAAGAALQLIAQLMTTELAYMPMAFWGELDVFMKGQAATVLVLGALWMRATRGVSSAGQIRPGESATDHKSDATRG